MQPMTAVLLLLLVEMVNLNMLLKDKLLEYFLKIGFIIESFYKTLGCYILAQHTN